MNDSPKSIEQLLDKAQPLAGIKLGELADICQAPCPHSPKHAKGWLGQILEKYLGASAGNLAEPDFLEIAVELKTLPLNQHGNPKESTYVTYAPIPFNESNWQQSVVRRKLKTVLWFPYLACGPMEQRLLATPFLWTMTQAWEQRLQQDWEELAEKLKLHQFEDLNGSCGSFLHIRPKAASSKILIDTTNHLGHPCQTVPKGFYLRDSFTKMIMQESFSV